MDRKFIVLEGLEGAGKSTAIKNVRQTLYDNGIHDIILTREPGGTPLAEKLRLLIKKQKNSNYDTPTATAELLLLYAARTQLLETVIQPALTRGTWVIGDRHDLSSQAYQGGGRGLDSTLLLTLRDIVLGTFRPDLTLYLDIMPEQGLQRANLRGQLDRIERESLAFFARTRARYLTLAADDPTIVIIDANQPLAQVNDTIRATLAQALKIWN